VIREVERMEPAPDRASAIGLTRSLCVVIVVLMAAAVVYSASLALRYFSHIGV
jgi:hypothetical protein